jgi:hypothetical protein
VPVGGGMVVNGSSQYLQYRLLYEGSSEAGTSVKAVRFLY